jgi:hypothetical protein
MAKKIWDATLATTTFPWEKKAKTFTCQICENISHLSCGGHLGSETSNNLICPNCIIFTTSNDIKEDLPCRPKDFSLCTYIVTQKNFMKQHYYKCHTCDEVDNLICSVCKKSATKTIMSLMIFTAIAVPKKTEAALLLHLGDRILLNLWRLHVLQQPVTTSPAKDEEGISCNNFVCLKCDSDAISMGSPNRILTKSQQPTANIWTDSDLNMISREELFAELDRIEIKK